MCARYRTFMIISMLHNVACIIHENYDATMLQKILLKSEIDFDASVLLGNKCCLCQYNGLLLHESQWNMARYFTSRQPYFHELQVSEKIA